MSVAGELLKAAGLAGFVATVTENLLERLGGPVLARIQESWGAATAATVPLNHDLERALRLAQLAGVVIMLSRHAEEVERLAALDGTRILREPFVQAGLDWVRAQCGLCR